MKYPTTILAIVSLTAPTVAAPAEPAGHQVLARSPPASSEGAYCGKCVLAGTGRLRELRTSVPADKCNTLPEGEHYGSCGNSYCGLCVMFKDNDCQGGITYAGGRGAGSYYCI